MRRKNVTSLDDTDQSSGRWRTTSFFSPISTPSEQTRGRSTSSAADLILRYESTQSNAFREYRVWKETKWGEDNLDEVEFEDDDVNLELSLPTIFSSPIWPSLSDCSSALGSAMVNIQERTVAYILATCDIVISSEYYLARPRELLNATKQAVALWVPHPPAWMVNNLILSCVTPPATDRQRRLKQMLDSPSWRNDDSLMRSDDDDDGGGEDDNRSICSSASVARQVTHEAGRLTRWLIGFLFGLATTISFTLVYVFATLSILTNGLSVFKVRQKAPRTKKPSFSH